MIRDPQSEMDSWPRGLFSFNWDEGERAYAALLGALAKERVETDTATLEMNARPRRSMADVKEEELEVAQAHIDEVRRRLRAFRAALEDARARAARDPDGEAAYDSANPQEDAMADVLIQYLVRTEHAEVRTVEPEPGHFVYYLKVAWDRLRQLAEQSGHPLPLPA